MDKKEYVRYAKIKYVADLMTAGIVATLRDLNEPKKNTKNVYKQIGPVRVKLERKSK